MVQVQCMMFPHNTRKGCLLMEMWSPFMGIIFYIHSKCWFQTWFGSQEHRNFDNRLWQVRHTFRFTIKTIVALKKNMVDFNFLGFRTKRYGKSCLFHQNEIMHKISSPWFYHHAVCKVGFN
jgi:hypothetical protein